MSNNPLKSKGIVAALLISPFAVIPAMLVLVFGMSASGSALGHWWLQKSSKYNLKYLLVFALIPAVVLSVVTQNILMFCFIGYFSLCVACCFWWLAPRR